MFWSDNGAPVVEARRLNVIGARLRLLMITTTLGLLNLSLRPTS